jgi:hypothetical protein
MFITDKEIDTFGNEKKNLKRLQIIQLEIYQCFASCILNVIKIYFSCVLTYLVLS